VNGRLVLVLSALVLSGCPALLKTAGYPPYATRKAPPTGLEASALAVGAHAPEFTLSGSTHEPFSSRGKGRLVLVFYRGDW
jgi:hypothetical protein